MVARPADDPNPVKVWSWRCALRDHGRHDLDRSIVATLMILSTYMDDDGFCYPSLETIADGAQVNEKTVRRHLKKAFALGWLHQRQVKAPKRGKGWRRNEYRACVPGDIELDRKHLALSDWVRSERGNLGDGPDIWMSTGNRSHGGVRPDISGDGPDISGDGPDIGRPMVRTSRCPMNSSGNSSGNSSERRAASAPLSPENSRIQEAVGIECLVAGIETSTRERSLDELVEQARPIAKRCRAVIHDPADFFHFAHQTLGSDRQVCDQVFDHLKTEGSL